MLQFCLRIKPQLSALTLQPLTAELLNRDGRRLRNGIEFASPTGASVRNHGACCFTTQPSLLQLLLSPRAKHAYARGSPWRATSSNKLLAWS